VHAVVWERGMEVRHERTPARVGEQSGDPARPVLRRIARRPETALRVGALQPNIPWRSPPIEIA